MIAVYLSLKWINNMPVYAVYSLIEFATLSIYFNYSIDVFRQKNTGYYIGACGVVLGILNSIFLQPINSSNSYFLFVEGIGIVTMSLFAFFRMLMREDDLKLHQYTHFWFAAILAFFWSVTFLNWGLSDYLYHYYPSVSLMVNKIILFLNMALYVMIGCVFILYPKLKTTNA